MKINSFKGFVILFSCVSIVSITIYQTFSRRSKEHKFYFNNIFSKPKKESFSPFFYHEEASYYDIKFNTEYKSRYNEDVVKEWKKFLKDKVKIEIIEYFLLNDSAKTEIQKIHSNVASLAELKHVTRFQLNDPQITNFFQFVYFAKVVEKSSVSSRYSWNYDHLIIPIVSKVVINQLIEKHKNSRDRFLKNRYWFQLIKGYFYSHRNNDLIIFFDKTKHLQPKNSLFYRAMFYVAGAYEQKKDFAKANYLYSIIFENSPNMRAIISNSFHPKNMTDFKQSLIFAKTTDEKCSLWALYGFRADKRLAIAEIYKLNAKNPHIDYLLPQMIDEEEARLNSLSITSPLLDKKQAKKNLDKDIFFIVKKIANEGKTLNPYIWQMASGYLSLFDRNKYYAKHQFNKAKKHLPKNKEFYNELRALELLCEITEPKLNTLSSEKNISNELKWLYSIKIDENDHNPLKNIQQFCKKYTNLLII